MQVIVDAESRLVVADARPAARCEGVTVLGYGLHHAIQAVARMYNLALGLE